MKKIITTLAFGLAFSAPAFAEDMVIKCDDATIAMIQGKLDAASQNLKDRVDVATGHLANAREAMKAGKTEDCEKELRSAADIAKDK